MMARCLEALRVDRLGRQQGLRGTVLSAFLVAVFLAPGLSLALTHRAGTAASSIPNMGQLLGRNQVERMSQRSDLNPWMYLLASGLVGPLALWTWRRARAMRMKSRLAIAREERERLARELHDTVIQDCTGLSVLLEAMASAAGRGEPMQTDLLDCAREQARQTVDNARNAVWNLRETKKDTDLIAALHDLAAQIASNGGSCVNVRHNVAFLPVPANSADEISMTVREAICNAVRHSGTEKILVDVCSDSKALRVFVQDYGCGLSAAAKPSDSKHYGIVGMRERMRRLGGGLQIDDIPGAGTTVQLMLRWRNMRRSTVWI